MAVTKNQTKITAEPGKQELFITREFDAPRELVFKAHTDAEMYSQWLGPRRLKMRFTKFEPRDAGEYAFVHTDTDRSAYPFHGEVHQVPPPARPTSTFRVSRG